jgi:hypothetical protein
MALPITALGSKNNTQNFIPSNDQWKVTELPYKASEALVDGGLVVVEVSGSSPTGYACKAGTTNANGQNVVGILAEPIAATDADYATAGKLKKVWVPVNSEAECFFSVGAGTFTAADVGRVAQVHTDSKSVAVDTNGLGVEITGYISSTKGKCKPFRVSRAVTA